MSRLEQVFNNLKSQNKKAFSVFLMSGYPDFETSLELMHLCSEKGVDFIELGMPFSDPSADGPTIKAAGEYSIQNGTTVKNTLELLQRFRQKNTKTPVVWMGYFNTIFNYGIENFLKQASDAGLDGLLIVDLPFEEQHRISSIKNYDIDTIRLITPTTSDARIENIINNSSGFIYFISIAGITGTKEAQEEKIKSRIQYIKTRTNLPIAVGFGIKNAQKAKKVNEFADGVIVGSAVVERITKNIENKNIMLKEVGDFLAEFSK